MLDERTILADIARRLLDYDREGTTAMAPRPHLHDPSSYTDPARFEREREALFLKTPQLVCFSSDLPEAGSFRTFDALGVPLLLIRGDDGRVRAFLNACAHRGMRLKDGCGKARLLTCRYHAWSYRLDGALKAINAEPTFGQVDKQSYGLTELPAAEDYGMVFAAASPGVEIDIEAMLGELAPLFRHWDLGSLQHIKSGEFHVDTNWKLALDTFCEGYHFASLHRDSVADFALSNVSDFLTFGPDGRNHRLAFPNTTIRAWHDAPEAEWGSADDIFAQFQLVHFIYPNISLLISPRACELFQIYPGPAVGQHVTHYSSYWRGNAALDSDEARAEAEAHFDFIWQVVETEDYAAGAAVQRSLNSGLVRRTTFGRNEPALINMHTAFERALAPVAAEAV
ncbi:MAG: aromatic ring-hydroxylating dioxygenase subunit alpha [Pseudomonadota bacterium]